MLRGSFLRLADSPMVRGIVTRSPLTGPVRRRFVAGETLDEFLAVARAVRSDGYAVTANLLGEAVREVAQARAATAGYLELLERLGRDGKGVNVSVKLTQLGLDLGTEHFEEHLARLVAKGRQVEAFLRFDMESSAYTERTLRVVEGLHGAGNRRVGVVLQAQLRRTPGDVRRMLDLGIPVRLCKGAYAESPEVALRSPSEVRAAFMEAARWLLLEGNTPAIATHDEELLEGIAAFATARGLDPQRFEFQMLYGVRRDLQREFLERGYRVRVYIPFGEHWYPYLMRRLAERPENVLFMAGSVAKESPLGALLRGEGRTRAGRRP